MSKMRWKTSLGLVRNSDWFSRSEKMLKII